MTDSALLCRFLITWKPSIPSVCWVVIYVWTKVMVRKWHKEERRKKAVIDFPTTTICVLGQNIVDDVTTMIYVIFLLLPSHDDDDVLCVNLVSPRLAFFFKMHNFHLFSAAMMMTTTNT